MLTELKLMQEVPVVVLSTFVLHPVVLYKAVLQIITHLSQPL